MTHSYKVLVTGGRNYNSLKELVDTLNFIHEQYNITELVHGAARGADTMAGEWAKANSIPVEEFPANWKRHGKAAGYIRNAEMLEKSNPDLVIAFHGGNGTKHMKELAKKKLYEIYDVDACKQENNE